LAVEAFPVTKGISTGPDPMILAGLVEIRDAVLVSKVITLD
jgi:hypothetical protein